MNYKNDIMDIDELSDFIKVKKSTIYKNLSLARKTGTTYIPYIKMNGRLLFSTSSVMSYLASMEVK